MSNGYVWQNAAQLGLQILYKHFSQNWIFVNWQVAEGSTIIDMTGADAVLVRSGKGDPGLFVQDSATVF